jgi:hypothetical protein
METLSIGQVARRAGVGVETVRFYEREGLLEDAPRLWLSSVLGASRQAYPLYQTRTTTRLLTQGDY